MLTFSEDLNAATAEDLANYVLTLPGRDNRFGTGDDGIDDIRTARYDAATRTVTLTPRRRFSALRFARLLVNGTAPRGLTDVAGNLLDGNRDGQPGGDYVATFKGVGNGPNGPQGGNARANAIVDRSFDAMILDHVDPQNLPAGKTRNSRFDI